MSRHHHLNLPKIKVPEYNALSTPEATPHSSLFNSFTHNTSNSSSTKPIFLPNTPIQTPHSSSTHSFPPLPSLKSLGNSLLRPTSASNTTLPPLVLPNTAYLSSPPAPQQIPHPKSPSSTVSLPPINEFSVPSPYSRPPQPLPPNAWCDQFYPTPNTPAYSPFTPLPYVPQHTNVPHAAGLGIFVPDNASPKNPQPFKNFIKAPPASREIKRRTKTGCMTCRKRRIKCDERHPTCFNCKKSKRVCINYDPVFRAARLRRKLLARRTVFGNGHSSARACVIKNKMDISSLLDAAAVIECTGKGMDGFHTNPLSKEYVGPLPKYPGSLPEYPGPLANPPWYELDNVCDQWDKVESFFALYIAPNLDALFALTPGGRFAQMAVMNLTRLSGLSLDGTAAITIPGSNGVAAHYGAPPPTPGLSPKELANITNVAPSSCTTRIGQSLAVLEVVRQLLVLLVPASFVFNNNLIIDESTVGKLEELRISNDYKALRAVFQLLFGTADPGAVSGFLEVADKDNELLTKLGILNTFVVPSTILDTPDLSNPDLSPVFAEMNQANELNTPHSLRPDIVWTLLAWLAQAGAHLSEQELQTSIRYASRELCRTHPKQARIDTGAGSLEMALLLGIHYHLTTRPDPRPDPGYVKSLLLDGTEFWNQNLVMRKLVHLLG